MNPARIRIPYLLGIFVLAFIWITLSQNYVSPIYAQSMTPTTMPPSPTPIISPNPIGSSAVVLTTTFEVDLAVLKSEVQMMRDYNQQLLSIVQWAIGGVLAIVVILLGAQWFTNVRTYERRQSGAEG